MVRLVGFVMILGACGFQITGGAAGQDARGSGDDDASDGAVDDMMVVDEMIIDANHADWWDPGWMHRRRITIHATSLTGAVTDFPVLVRLPALSGTLAGGGDLRFRSIDNTTAYPYELDSFNAAGTSLVWIKLSLTTAADKELWVYYGNSQATPESSGSAVFATNHLSVHHLGSLLDATANGHNASNGGGGSAPTSNVACQIGGCRTFDGTDDYLSLANSDGPYDFTNQMYASAWIRVAGFEDPYQAIITKGDSSWRLARSNESNGVAFGWTNQGTNDNLLGNSPVAGGQWHHVAITQTGTTKSVFVDGTLDESRQDSDQLDSNNVGVRIGMNEESDSGGQRYWHGDIDEVRISSIARDAAWIYAEVKTTDAAFATVGADEAY